MLDCSDLMGSRNHVSKADPDLESPHFSYQDVDDDENANINNPMDFQGKRGVEVSSKQGEVTGVEGVGNDTTL